VAAEDIDKRIARLEEKHRLAMEVHATHADSKPTGSHDGHLRKADRLLGNVNRAMLSLSKAREKKRIQQLLHKPEPGKSREHKHR
jgi:hypothetical protein